MRYAFVIDQSRCIGCHACSLACKAEHEVPLGSYRTWVKYVEKGSFPDVRRYFSVLRCNHCDAAPCITICPVTALFRRDDGIVDFDRDVCIGCKACMQACPYDALYIHPDNGTAEKCNFCAHRIEIDMEPPCATVCPTEAILVGDIDNPESRVSRLIATKQVSVRKPEKATKPKVFYIEGEPRALTPGAADPSGGYLWSERQGVASSDYATVSYETVGGSAAAVGTSDGEGNGSRRVPNAGRGENAGPATGESTAKTTGPAAWLESDLPPAAAAQALAAAAVRGEADFYTGAWAGLSPARTVYDVAHAESPWGWKVSAYLWTKSVAAGAFIMAALGPWLGLEESGAANAGMSVLGLLFLVLTGILLVADLKRPERFWTVLTRPNWGSWLARGAFILTALGVLAVAWSAVALAGLGMGAAPDGVAAQLDAASPGGVPIHPSLLMLLRWSLVAAAVAAAGYSGYLFAQAKGRDFWQSPLLPLHLVVQALAAGAAAMLIALSHSAAHSHQLPLVLAVALALHLMLIAFGEVTVAHATRDGALAARAMVRGRYARSFWLGVALAVVSIATALSTEPVGPGAVISGVAALAGLAAYEHAWNLAGQAPPLS